MLGLPILRRVIPAVDDLQRASATERLSTRPGRSIAEKLSQPRAAGGLHLDHIPEFLARDSVVAKAAEHAARDHV